MDNLLKKFKNIIFGKKEAKEIANSLTDLNKITGAYINILEKEKKEKEENVKRIRILVQGSVTKDMIKSSSTLNIAMVDAENIQVTQDGARSKSNMKWQKEMTKFTRQTKGTIVSGMSANNQKKGTIVSGMKDIQKLRNKGKLI